MLMASSVRFIDAPPFNHTAELSISLPGNRKRASLFWPGCKQIDDHSGKDGKKDRLHDQLTPFNTIMVWEYDRHMMVHSVVFWNIHQ